MRPSRREFLQLVAATGAASLYPWRSAYAYYATPGTPIKGTGWPGISKYATSLRGVGPGGIPVAASDGLGFGGATHYSLTVGEFRDQLHPSLGPTTLWGYNPSLALGGGVQPQKHLGGIIVANRGVPIQLTVSNRLPAAHTLPVDVSVPMVGGFPEALGRFGGSGHNAISQHLHGGFVPWPSDGGPMAWYTPNGNAGKSYMQTFMKQLNPALAAGQGEYYYPNNQSARLMWYHDHAHDITRLNAYAGIASAYVLRDAFEGGLRNQGLPDFVENGGKYEIPLIVQDKIFVGPDIALGDPTWSAVTTAKSQTVGSLWYPHLYEKSRWKFTGNVLMPDPSCIPEMFGDTMLVNGTVFPQATVEARRYRFRFLNACQARFLNLQLYVADTSKDGITYSNQGVPLNVKGPDFLVIGSEGGFLPKPVVVPGAQPFNPLMLTNRVPNLITAPAERWDLVVDFKAFAGKSVILYTDAPAPFPMAAAGTDFFAGNANGVTTKPGFGPDTRIMMKFNVVAATSVDPPMAISPATDLTPGLDPFIVPPGVAVQNGVVNLPPGTPVRQLTLNEAFDSIGRLIQLVGPNTLNPAIAGTYGRAYMDPVTEHVASGATEVWQIANLTGDTHPIHFHLVNCQVVARQPFNVGKYAGTPIYTGPARNPDPTELGWKETVKMHPGEVTTVIMRFDLPTVPLTVPASPNTGGHEYVWHCHILEHEEHDMMRPLVVI